MTRPPRLILLPIGLAWSSLAGGCHAPPITVHAGDDCVQCAALCSNSDLWRFDAHDQPTLPAGSRVAILECSVEFVTMKQVTPGARQAIVGGPYTPLSALTDISGVFRKRVSYPPRVREVVPYDVYGIVAESLESRGLIVLDAKHVVATRAYRALPRTGAERSSPVRHLDPRGSDTGRATEFHVAPAAPLHILDPRSAKVARAERAIREELDADLTLRIRLRVGLYHGHVAIERGSVIAVSTTRSSSRTTSRRSVVSRESVAVSEEYELVAGRKYAVDWRSFRTLVLGMVPAYVAAGLPAVADRPYAIAAENLPAGPGH